MIKMKLTTQELKPNYYALLISIVTQKPASESLSAMGLMEGKAKESDEKFKETY